jgi:hypothetical protein
MIQIPAQAEEKAMLAAQEDDLDFSDMPLGTRQANANQEIVCEGGCE